MSKAFRHRTEYRAVLGVRWIVRRLPHRAALGVGTMLGRFFCTVDVPHRRLALANLAAAFPHWSAAERQKVVRDVFQHFGRLLIEVLRFSSLSPDEMRDLVEFEGQERTAEALRAGKGVLFITGHFGFWELHAIAHALVQPPIAVVARPLDNPHLHELLEQVRTATGNSVIYRRGGLRKILRALTGGVGVAVLIDQHIQTDAVLVDFFGRPAATTTAVATLALRTGAPVIPVFALPLADGRYRMIYEPPIEVPREGPDAVRELTQRCTDVLEMYVRRYPHLWLWMHRRWRDVEPAAAGMFPQGTAEEED